MKRLDWGMISDNDRNVRTLIVSFVIAIMVLIPLRFYEAGQESLGASQAQDVQVLGAETEATTVASPTPTPNPAATLEAPWDQVDGLTVR